MRYILTEYKTKMNLVHKAMDCFLFFDVYFFKWKIGTKKVEIYLSNYVNWSDFFKLWDGFIQEKSIITKEAFKRTFY